MPAASSLTRSAGYAADALPERQPAVALLLPTSVGGLAAGAAAISAVTLLAIGVSVAETITARPVFTAGEPFLHLRSALRTAIDLRLPSAIAVWLGSLFLLTAAVVAAVVGMMRRHRRDGRQGSARTWAALAIVMAAAGCAAEVPIGSITGGLFADLTGIALGPGGIGWWFLIAAVAVGGVWGWAILSLADRLGTSIWLAIAGSAWLAAAGCTSLGRTDAAVVWSTAAWATGAAAALIGMLTAARSVIREARGESGRARARVRPVEQQASRATPSMAALAANQQAAADDGETEFVDGSEDHASFRHLSKAERKRLKKLARLQRAG